jgi:hypothetical protein
MGWWMVHYGSKSPKRHIAYSNNKDISRLNRGRLTGWKSENNANTKPVRTYMDKNGKKKFVGTKHLKKTQ